MMREFGKCETQIVKGVAILCMLFYHLFQNEQLITSMQVEYGPLSLEGLLLISGFGNICVAIFAFLSAYGITKGLMAGERKRGIPVSAPESLGGVYTQAGKRCLKLIGNFAAMFAGVNLLWFSKFDYVGLYGKGWQGGFHAVLDGLGLAELFDTPTLNQTWWYMKLAIIIIFMVPLLYMAVCRFGNYTLVLAVLLPGMIEMSYDIKRYYFVVLLGVVAACGNWFEKLDNMKCPVWLQCVLGTLLMVLAVPVRQNYVVYNQFGYLVDAPIALFMAWYIVRIFASIPGIWHALYFLGKHSMNIYFVHTFFYMAIYHEFVYSFRYPLVILLVLLVLSLAFSLVLEGVKKVCYFFVKKALQLL